MSCDYILKYIIIYIIYIHNTYIIYINKIYIYIVIIIRMKNIKITTINILILFTRILASYCMHILHFYFRATLGEKEVLQSPKY